MQKIYRYDLSPTEGLDNFVKELQDKAKLGWTVQTITTVRSSIVVIYNVKKKKIKDTDPPY